MVVWQLRVNRLQEAPAAAICCIGRVVPPLFLGDHEPPRLTPRTPSDRTRSRLEHTPIREAASTARETGAIFFAEETYLVTVCGCLDIGMVILWSLLLWTILSVRVCLCCRSGARRKRRCEGRIAAGKRQAQDYQGTGDCTKRRCGWR